MVALNEELSGIADRPQRYLGSTAGSRGTNPGSPGSMSRNHPRSVPYCSDSYFPGPDFSRHYARNRNYSPSLGRWIDQDPAGFINGANMYQFVMSDPVEFTDPLGRSWYNPQSWGWVQTTEGTFRDAVGIDGGAVAGAFWTGAVQGLGQEFGSDLYIYSQWAQALNQRLQDIGGPIMDGVNLLGRASPIGVQGWYGTLDNNAGIEVGSGAGIQGTTTWGGSTTGSIDGNGQTSVGQSTGTDRVGIDTGGVVSAPFEIPDSPWGGAILFNSGMAAQELEQLAKALRGGWGISCRTARIRVCRPTMWPNSLGFRGNRWASACSEDA